MDQFKQLRIDKINEALLFYEEYFTKYFATVISLTEKIPEQINNEIRNAFSHLVRVNIAQTKAEIIDEAAKAIGHIERACRDCLKICIAESYDNIKLQCDYALTYYKAISPNHTAEKRWLIEERKNISLEEIKGEKSLTGRFEELLSRMLALKESLEEQYGLQPRKASKIKLLLTQWLGAGVAAGIGKVVFIFIGAGLMWLAKYCELI